MKPSGILTNSLPTLEVLSNPPEFTNPIKCINSGNDVPRFLASLAYRDIGIFITQLNNSVCPRTQAKGSAPKTFPLTSTPSSIASIQAVQRLLSDIETFIEQAPPDPAPRRFGNVSFRKWYGILERSTEDLLSNGLFGETLGKGKVDAKQEVGSYLLGAFGSAQRLDYGTGHELSFLAFLGCLWKLGFFSDGAQGGIIEREIVLKNVEPYLRVVRKLILTYNLEPAGSHGVWGLDDHSFIPYIFGSAQFARSIAENEPTPLEGSVQGAPKPSSITNPGQVENYRSTNMYFSAIGFINDVKKGPFWEHSPMLYDISGIKDGWGKINKGMMKMFNAEVLSKFPVIQHFAFGSLFSWDRDPEAPTPVPSAHLTHMPPTATAQNMAQVSPAAARTAAPWAHAAQMTNVENPPSVRHMPPKLD